MLNINPFFFFFFLSLIEICAFAKNANITGALSRPHR
jgi:hypothetical protein